MGSLDSWEFLIKERLKGRIEVMWIVVKGLEDFFGLGVFSLFLMGYFSMY